VKLAIFRQKALNMVEISISSYSFVFSELFLTVVSNLSSTHIQIIGILLVVIKNYIY